MKIWICARIFVVLSFALIVVGQRADDLRMKYGPPDEKGVYTVRPTIGLIVRFGKTGQAAEMLIRRLDSQEASGGVATVMSTEVTKEILEEVAPAATRGKLQKTAKAAFGCTMSYYAEYERLHINTVTRCDRQGGGVYSARISWK